MQTNINGQAYFDQIKCMHDLESAGVPRQQAEAQTAQFGQVVAFIHSQQITKNDLSILEERLKSHHTETVKALEVKMTQIEAKLEKKITELRADVEKQNAQLRADVEKQNAQLRADVEKQNTQLRADVEKQMLEVESRLLKTMITSIFAAFSITTALLGALITYLH